MCGCTPTSNNLRSYTKFGCFTPQLCAPYHSIQSHPFIIWESFSGYRYLGERRDGEPLLLRFASAYCILPDRLKWFAAWGKIAKDFILVQFCGVWGKVFVLFCLFVCFLSELLWHSQNFIHGVETACVLEQLNVEETKTWSVVYPAPRQGVFWLLKSGSLSLYTKDCDLLCFLRGTLSEKHETSSCEKIHVLILVSVPMRKNFTLIHFWRIY